MFAYCLNNPPRRADPTGRISYAQHDDPNNDNTPLNDVARIGSGSISRGTFRIKLVQLTGENPQNSDAHHIFPFFKGSEFQTLGINVNDPRYGSWVESSTHRHFSYEYNQWWTVFFSIPDVTQADAFALVEFLAILFDFELHY